MSYVETLHARRKQRLARIAKAAASPKIKHKPNTNVFSIPNTPFGVPKIAEAKPFEPPPEDWVERQLRIHKQPWFSIEDGPRDFDPPRPGPSIKQIKRVVCEHFGLTEMQLITNRRLSEIVKPRQIGMYLSKLLTPLSYPEIGRRFGGKDHTTVLHSARVIEREIASDERVAASVEMLIAKLGGIPE